ncbi:MAG: hypothetical protein KH333_09300 [Clostridium sp.]|nr:hypothetical protein [Clostridium sp.]
MGILSNFTKKIRNAIYVKEVRDAIADGLETVEALEEKNLEIYNNMVIGAGESNAEIVDARLDNNTGVRYEKVGKRLDKISSQIAEIKSLKANNIAYDNPIEHRMIESISKVVGKIIYYYQGVKEKEISSANYIIINVENVEKIYVSLDTFDRSYSSTAFNYVVFTDGVNLNDSSVNLLGLEIETPAGESSVQYRNKEIIVPTNSKFAFVNYCSSGIEPIIYYNTSKSVKDVLDTLLYKEVIFDTFPNESVLEKLPNNSFFRTRGFYFVDDGFGCMYKISKSKLTNSLYKNSKYYIKPIQPDGEVFLPYYGIRTGKDYGDLNSIILEQINFTNGNLLKLPVGHFYFEKEINLETYELMLSGEPIPLVYSNRRVEDMKDNGLTWLHFLTIDNGGCCIKGKRISISNINICGNSESYTNFFNRTNTYTNPDCICTETVNSKITGIKVTEGGTLTNCSFSNLYVGVKSNISNFAINNVTILKCHTGLSVLNDTKIDGLYCLDTIVGLEIGGSITSASNIRGDNVVHLVNVRSGRSVFLSNLDADYCLESILHVGNLEEDTWNNIQDLVVDGVCGRSNIIKAYDTTKDNECTALDITEDTYIQYPIISVGNNVTLKGGVFLFSGIGKTNPFDEESNYRTPSIIMSNGKKSIVSDIQIQIANSDVELTKDWLDKKIKSFSTYPQNTILKIITAKGDMYYNKSGETVTCSKQTTEKLS